MRHVISVLIMALFASPRAQPQEMGSITKVPLAQLPGNNLHPDFTSLNHGLDYTGTRGLWLAWDTGTVTQRNVYVRQYDRQTKEWGDPLAITVDSTLNQNPDIELFGDSVLVIWESNYRGNFDIMYSLFDGNHWSEPAFLTSDLADDRRPRLYSLYEYPDYRTWKSEAISAWEREGEIFWSRFDGHNWSFPVPMSENVDSARCPDIGGEFGFPFMVWEGCSQNNWDLYGSWFLPDSNRWRTPLRLTKDPEEDRNPTLGNAYIYYVPVVHRYSGGANIVWQTHRDGNWEIYIGSLSVSEGNFLIQLQNLSQHDGSDVNPDAQLIPYGDYFIVVSSWGSNRTGFEDICLNDPYVVFLLRTYNVTEDSIPDAHPVLSQTVGLDYWLAWESLRNSHWEIWGVRVTIFSDDVTPIGKGIVPASFRLMQNYPNPFNASTLIRYQLPVPAHVSLKIYNLLGQEVRTLVDRAQEAGYHEIRWDGKNQKGKEMPSGVYFCKMQTTAAGDNFIKTMKLLLLK